MDARENEKKWIGNQKHNKWMDDRNEHSQTHAHAVAAATTARKNPIYCSKQNSLI